MAEDIKIGPNISFKIVLFSLMVFCFSGLMGFFGPLVFIYSVLWIWANRSARLKSDHFYGNFVANFGLFFCPAKQICRLELILFLS